MRTRARLSLIDSRNHFYNARGGRAVNRAIEFFYETKKKGYFLNDGKFNKFDRIIRGFIRETRERVVVKVVRDKTMFGV